MKTLVVFLNELSFTSERVAPEAILAPVISTLATVRAAKRIRNDLVVVGNVPLSGVLLGDGSRSLAEILRGDDYREEWRFLSSLDQSSPWDKYSGSTRPGDLQEVRFQGQTAIGMLWAKQNNTSIVSFAFAPSWTDDHVQAQFRQMDQDAKISSNDVQIPNLSRSEHVTTHLDLITNYGRAVASSLIYREDTFGIRMYFNDHHPLPHFHVVAPNAPDPLASYSIATLDLLAGELSPVLRRRVTEWAAPRRDELLQNWNRCRAGQHPFSLED